MERITNRDFCQTYKRTYTNVLSHGPAGKKVINNICALDGCKHRRVAYNILGYCIYSVIVLYVRDRFHTAFGQEEI